MRLSVTVGAPGEDSEDSEEVLDKSDSSYDLEEECVAGCHSLTGQACLWRQSWTSLGHNYSSCSPPIASCLDGFCDDFEKLSPSLCPQDCYSPEKGEFSNSFLPRAETD